jgi:hypothetical protein
MTATQDRYEPTQDDWAGFEEWLDSLPEQLPTPEDFGPTPERVAEILAEFNGLPF